MTADAEEGPAGRDHQQLPQVQFQTVLPLKRSRILPCPRHTPFSPRLCASTHEVDFPRVRVGEYSRTLPPLASRHRLALARTRAH